MKKFIIEQDKKGIEADLHPYERKAWLLNLFLDRMTQAGYPVENVEQVASVLTVGVENYVRTQIVEGSHFELAGVKLNRSALMDVVELPDIKEVQSVERILKQYAYVPTSALEFKDGKFLVPAELKEKITAKHTMYAVNDRHVEMFRAAQKVVRAINAFHREFGQEQGRSLNSHQLGTPERYIKFNPGTWEWEVDTLVIAGQFP